MTRWAILLAAIYASLPVRASEQDLANIKAAYQATTAQLEKHLAPPGMFLDDDSQSPVLLAKQWSLAAEWLAASLNARDRASPEDVKSAMLELAPSKKPEFIALDPTTFVVSAPSEFDNFFIVTRTGGRYRVAWSTASPQSARGKWAQDLAAWLPQNSRDQRRDSLSAGPVDASLSSLPSDAKGRPRFYLDGTYREPVGIVVPAQISIWVWDGSRARPLFVERYGVDIGQDVGTRLEGNLLKIRNEENFRIFSAPCDCEVRPFDHVLRIAGDGVHDLGNRSLVPELDAIDELYDRLINGKSARDIASTRAIEAANVVWREVRRQTPPGDWRRFPSLGMLQGRQMDKTKGVLCVDADGSGPYLYRLEQSAGRVIVEDITKSDKGCAN